MRLTLGNLLLWIVLVIVLIVFTGVNTYFAMYEQVDTFERRHHFHLKNISADIEIDEDLAYVLNR